MIDASCGLHASGSLFSRILMAVTVAVAENGSQTRLVLATPHVGRVAPKSSDAPLAHAFTLVHMVSIVGEMEIIFFFMTCMATSYDVRLREMTV